jgi:Tfp pilus assembly protein FimT
MMPTLRATITKRDRRIRGISIVELSIVIAILALCAVVVMPGVVGIQRSRAIKDLEASVARLPVVARNDAIRTQTPVQMKIEGSSLVVEQTDANGGQPKTLTQVQLSDDLRADNAQQNGQSVDTGSFQWTAYPDGSTDSGGIEFDEHGASKSLNLPANGGAQWINGQLPDPSEQQWQAGQLQERNGSSSTPAQ